MIKPEKKPAPFPVKKMAQGGKTNEQMFKLGRNEAKIANQKSGKRGK